MRLLVAETKNERGYTATGRLISRVLAALTSIYATDSRLVNEEEWNSKGKATWYMMGLLVTNTWYLG